MMHMLSWLLNIICICQILHCSLQVFTVLRIFTELYREGEREKEREMLYRWFTPFYKMAITAEAGPGQNLEPRTFTSPTWRQEPKHWFLKHVRWELDQNRAARTRTGSDCGVPVSQVAAFLLFHNTGPKCYNYQKEKRIWVLHNLRFRKKPSCWIPFCGSCTLKYI